MKLTAATTGRADLVVGDALELGRRALARLFAAGLVRKGGRPLKKGDSVGVGDEIEVVGDGSLAPVPEPDRPLEVIHEDARIVVVAKPAGWPSHPLDPGEHGTLANALVARYPETISASPDPREGGLVHRLDAGTTGLLAAARDPAAYAFLRLAFHEGRVEKEYLALVVGVVTRAGEIDLPLVPGPRVRVVQDGAPGALAALTRFEPVRRAGAFTLLRCHAHTGRLHQIRAHLAHLGTPVVGDDVYGIRVAGQPVIVGHFLHANRLRLPHPDGGAIDLAAALPTDRAAALDALTS